MRADKFFADKFGSRTKAAEELTAGRILRGGKALSPKDEVSEADEFTFLSASERFVSSGGYKLSRALKEFSFSCFGKVFVDIGASTGGFTDCLLQNGAKKVFAVDVGESLLHPTLSNDPRVVCMDNVNARYLSQKDFPCSIDGVTADVSFISLKHIFPVISAILGIEPKDAFVLIKPQFECEKQGIGKSGIVRLSRHKDIIKNVLSFAAQSALTPVEITNAPLKKGKNLEYILHLQNTPEVSSSASAANRSAAEKILAETERIIQAARTNR